MRKYFADFKGFYQEKPLKSKYEKLKIKDTKSLNRSSAM